MKDRVVMVLAVVLTLGALVWLFTHPACVTPLQNLFAFMVVVSALPLAAGFVSEGDAHE